MKKINVAINGFGRIGRTFLRKVFLDEKINIVAINDLTAPDTLAHLLKYDSIHGKFPASVEAGENYIVVNRNRIDITAEKDPSQLPWGKLNIDVVLESTGKFTKEDDAKKHIIAGAKKVIISAPATGDIKSVVMGVNENILDGSELVISNASCTTNNAAPMIALLDKNFEIEDAYVTTVHAYTGDQNIHDAPHKDLRRSRAAAHSIIPTTTGAAKAIAEVFPHLKGLIGGAGIRVPVIDGSLTDITCVVKKPATVEAINELFKHAAENELKGILEYTDEPIVSVDIIGNNHSCIFDYAINECFGKDGKGCWMV